MSSSHGLYEFLPIQNPEKRLVINESDKAKQPSWSRTTAIPLIVRKKLDRNYHYNTDPSLYTTRSWTWVKQRQLPVYCRRRRRTGTDCRLRDRALCVAVQLQQSSVLEPTEGLASLLSRRGNATPDIHHRRLAGPRSAQGRAPTDSPPAGILAQTERLQTNAFRIRLATR